MTFQVSPCAGIDIIWSSGSGINTAGGFTATEIDNEIAYNGISSIMETHRTLYNKWLSECKVSTDVGEDAHTVEQQALLTRTFRLICFYAYSKEGLIQELSKGKCDCDCEEKKNRYLRMLSEDIICKSISIKCLKDKYLNWLHGHCDSKTSWSGFFGSEIVTKECPPIIIKDIECGCGG